jgi:hypothetical protein
MTAAHIIDDKVTIFKQEQAFALWLSEAGLPHFSWYNIPKRGKIYQLGVK